MDKSKTTAINILADVHKCPRWIIVNKTKYILNIHTIENTATSTITCEIHLGKLIKKGSKKRIK